MGSEPSSTAMLERPNRLIQKISGGPKARANSASGGESVISETALTMPPTAEETHAIFKARSARPCWAIG